LGRGRAARPTLQPVAGLPGEAACFLHDGGTGT